MTLVNLTIYREETIHPFLGNRRSMYGPINSYYSCCGNKWILRLYNIYILKIGIKEFDIEILVIDKMTVRELSQFFCLLLDKACVCGMRGHSRASHLLYWLVTVQGYQISIAYCSFSILLYR